jgi:argininosuccinate lyase
MIATMKVNKATMRAAVDADFSNATDIADYLAAKGMPFRQAHEVIGKTVLYCIQQGKVLLQLTLEEYKQFSELFEGDIFEVLQPETVVNARNVFGGTARNQVERALASAETKLAETTEWVDQYVMKSGLEG